MLITSGPAPRGDVGGSCLPLETVIRSLLEYAVLAPSSHNSQPWRFLVAGATVEVHADPDRWLRVADDDQRELFLSVGCAVENLLIAARENGLDVATRFFPDGGNPHHVATLILRMGISSPDRESSQLFEAIRRRRTNRSLFRETEVGDEAVARLEAAVVAPLELSFFRDVKSRRLVEELTSLADREEFADPAWRRELAAFVADGSLGARWPASSVAAAVIRTADLGDTVARRNVRLLRSAPLVGILTTETDDRRSQVEAGRAFQRAWLLATAMGLQLQPLSEALQIDPLRSCLSERLTPGRIAQQIFRLGYGEPVSTRSPRLPVSAVS